MALRRLAYVDVFAAQNLADFARRFGAAVIGTMDPNFERALKAATPVEIGSVDLGKMEYEKQTKG